MKKVSKSFFSCKLWQTYKWKKTLKSHRKWAKKTFWKYRFCLVRLRRVSSKVCYFYISFSSFIIVKKFKNKLILHFIFKSFSRKLDFFPEEIAPDSREYSQWFFWWKNQWRFFLLEANHFLWGRSIENCWNDEIAVKIPWKSVFLFLFFLPLALHWTQCNNNLDDNHARQSRIGARWTFIDINCDLWSSQNYCSGPSQALSLGFSRGELGQLFATTTTCPTTIERIVCEHYRGNCSRLSTRKGTYSQSQS